MTFKLGRVESISSNIALIKKKKKKKYSSAGKGELEDLIIALLHSQACDSLSAGNSQLHSRISTKFAHKYSFNTGMWLKATETQRDHCLYQNRYVLPPFTKRE